MQGLDPMQGLNPIHFLSAVASKLYPESPNKPAGVDSG